MDENLRMGRPTKDLKESARKSFVCRNRRHNYVSTENNVKMVTSSNHINDASLESTKSFPKMYTFFNLGD